MRVIFIFGNVESAVVILQILGVLRVLNTLGYIISSSDEVLCFII